MNLLLLKNSLEKAQKKEDECRKALIRAIDVRKSFEIDVISFQLKSIVRNPTYIHYMVYSEAPDDDFYNMEGCWCEEHNDNISRKTFDKDLKREVIKSLKFDKLFEEVKKCEFSIVEFISTVPVSDEEVSREVFAFRNEIIEKFDDLYDQSLIAKNKISFD